MSDVKIMELCEDTFLVDGVILRALDHGLFNIHTEEGRAVLAERARRYKTGFLSTHRFGALTVCCFHLMPNGHYLLADERHASKLPDEAKTILRKEYPEHADEI